MQPPRILVVPGSNRSGSHNARLAGAIVKALTRLDCEITRITLRDYELPLFDAGLERDNGQPQNARKLARLFHEHDAVMLVSPEYNASLPPLTKNTIDWISRISKDGGKPLKPFSGKLAALCSSSSGNFAGIRGLYHLRAVAMNVGLTVISEQCTVPRAGEAFNADGSLRDERTAAAMERCCTVLVETSRALARTDLDR